MHLKKFINLGLLNDLNLNLVYCIEPVIQLGTGPEHLSTYFSNCPEELYKKNILKNVLKKFWQLS
jgi:hypothetical protein